jgi:hypothetical protein
MGIIDQKLAVFGQISALRTLNEDFPKFNLTNSFPSVNNEKDGLAFIIDLLKALVGYEELRDILIDTLTFDMDDIESAIKLAVKKDLKKLVNCGVDPSIPDFLKHQSVSLSGTGVDLNLNGIDFTGLMYIDPEGSLGNLFYDDVTNGVNSTDFNTFLYNTVQSDGTQENWGTNTTSNNILSLEFNSVGAVNNTLNISASQFYSTPANGKTLTDLNNDYIDSIKLFDSAKLINNIIDTLFGSVTVNLNKTRKQLEQEAKVENIVNSIINTDEDDVIDDNFFTFTNEEIRFQEEIADNRRKGIRKVFTCREVISEVSVDSLTTLQEALSGTTTKVEEKQAYSDAINAMGDESGDNADEQDKYNIKLSFIEGLIKKIMLAIVNALLSPKVILLFALNHKIINGLTSSFDGAIDFMKQNKALIRNVINSVRDTIVKILLKQTLIAIKNLAATNAVASLTEKVKSTQAQLLSLVGIPNDVIRKINNLG